MSPTACITVAVVGTLTALFAATIGLKQWDIKKVLAYSTISQLGYMFMGVGAGAYAAGMFHLVTHAFFKALLFLGSGSVIFAMHRAYHHTGSHEDAQDMRNMGGLRKFMPVTFVLMWIATLAIAGVPPFSGFFSKDGILGAVFARAQHGALAEATWLGMPGSTVLYVLYGSGCVTAFLTAIYMTRMMLYTFHGPNRTGEAERAQLARGAVVDDGTARGARRAERVRRLAQSSRRDSDRSDRRAREVAGAGNRRGDCSRRGSRGRRGDVHRVRAHRRRGRHRAARHRGRSDAAQAQPRSFPSAMPFRRTASSRCSRRSITWTRSTTMRS